MWGREAKSIGIERVVARAPAWMVGGEEMV